MRFAPEYVSLVLTENFEDAKAFYELQPADPVAIWLYVGHRPNYPLYRNAFLISGAIGLVVFGLAPLAPPARAGLRATAASPWTTSGAASKVSGKWAAAWPEEAHLGNEVKRYRY